MRLREFTLTGANGFTTIIAPEGIEFPSCFIDGFRSYCGAGRGIGDLVVPEKMYGLKVSPACFVHDKMWEMSKATWEDFHLSNGVFLTNLISIIESQSKNVVLKHLRLYRAVSYFNAVDTIGAKIFWKEKNEEAK